MSIYSGFATRNQEQTYDQLIFNLIQVLSRKILKTYHHQESDQPKFAQIIKDIFMKLSLMEKQKYLQPNLSNALYDIMEYIIQQDKNEEIELNSKTPKFWVKIQKKEDENFTNDTQKEPEAKISSIKTTSHFQTRIKTPFLNPEGIETQRRREKQEQYAIPLKNKFNKQKNSASKQKQWTKKHQSLKRFQQKQSNQTIYHKERASRQFKCPHCNQETVFDKQKKPLLHRNQRSDSLQKRQKEHSRIVVPELVKEYIEATNHTYMKQFRKRKVRNGPEFY